MHPNKYYKHKSTKFIQTEKVIRQILPRKHYFYAMQGFNRQIFISLPPKLLLNNPL